VFHFGLSCTDLPCKINVLELSSFRISFFLIEGIITFFLCCFRMGRPILGSCCRCGTLKTGTIITGVIGILLAIATICFIFLTKVKMRTFILQDLDPFIGKHTRYTLITTIEPNKWYRDPISLVHD